MVGLVSYHKFRAKESKSGNSSNIDLGVDNILNKTIQEEVKSRKEGFICKKVDSSSHDELIQIKFVIDLAAIGNLRFWVFCLPFAVHEKSI